MIKNTEAAVYFGNALTEKLMSPYYSDSRSEKAKELIFMLYLFTGEGHVCLNISNSDFRNNAVELYKNYQIEKIPQITDEYKDLSAVFPEVFGKAGDFKPVICENGTRYYFHKHFTHEISLANAIHQLLRESENASEIELDSVWDKFSKDNPMNDERKRAITHPLKSKFTVITGGPGTGKTSAIIHILTLLAMTARRKPRYYLCAPTGKAAMRLRDAVISGKKDMGSILDETQRSYIPETAHTLHSLIRFNYNSHYPIKKPVKPIIADCVIVDESSMMDLFLATSLFKAFSPETRFVLLGDANQLSSVEAGSVFQDLCETLSSNDQYRHSFFTFKENFRFLENPTLANLSQTILNGDSTDFFQQIELRKPNIKYEELSTRLLAPLIENYTKQIIERIKNVTPDNFRDFARGEIILSTLRRGLFGSEYLNRQIENGIRRKLYGNSQNEWYHGRKIMVLVNRGEFNNGDIAVCLKRPDGKLRLYFDKETPNPDYPLYIVNTYEPAYSMTVHKSQGSEYDTVNIIFPDEDSRLLSRELLYTAATRAKKTLNIYGNKNIIQQCIIKKAFRETGLKKKMENISE